MQSIQTTMNVTATELPFACRLPPSTQIRIRNITSCWQTIRAVQNVYRQVKQGVYSSEKQKIIIQKSV